MLVLNRGFLLHAQAIRFEAVPGGESGRGFLHLTLKDFSCDIFDSSDEHFDIFDIK